ncbi:MAG: hypothetical protein IKL51_06590, partial [Lachnospiraceae bacterium]|nr:hypothetical protein [Lachnospiraceae bacterium]
ITSQTIFTNQEVLYATWHAVEEDQIWIKEIPQQLYTGAAIKPVVEVYKGKELLVSGKDYTVSYKNNTNVYEGNDDKKKPQVIVTGKGNYGQKVTKYFEILPKDLNDMGITIDEGLLIKAATKKVQKLVPTIKDGKKTLRSKTDFILTYPMESTEGAYQKAGQYRIIVTGKGNYKGTRTLQMRLVGDEATLITKASVKNVVTKPYSGNAIQQEPVITVGKTTLIKGQDYKLLYDNNVEIGTATMQIVGCGAYAGTKTVTFKITGTAISKAFIASGLENREYSGEEHRPQPVILKSKTSNQALVAGKDYLLSYSKNKEVGTANITITGIGAYTGTIKKSFKITAYDVKNTDISVEGEEALTVEYAVGGCNPKPTVKFKGEPLQQGVDYTVSYKNNTKLANNDAAKAPTLVITGKKNFKGSKTIFFSIVPASFDHLTLSAADIVEPKKADKWKTTLSVTNSNGKKLKAGTDYEKELIYSYAEDALMKDGTTKVKGTIVEKGDIPVAGSIIKVQIRSTGINYKANEIASTTYRIVDSTKNISKGTFKIQDKYFTGQEIIIQGNDFTKAEISKLPPLGYGSDYEIIEGSYKNNIKKGTASVMLRGINTYYGTKTVSFKIIPKNLNSQN